MTSTEPYAQDRNHEPDVNKLQDQIEKSGKPLEIVVSSFLDKYGWQGVCNTDTFIDREGGSSETSTYALLLGIHH